jgi:hypothetical protein
MITSKGMPWTCTERRVLLDLWTTLMPTPEILVKLPGRSVRSARQQAANLGLRRPRELHYHYQAAKPKLFSVAREEPLSTAEVLELIAEASRP